MRLLFLTSVYSSYLENFYRRHPRLAERGFSEQRKALQDDMYSWIGVWPHWLQPHGYEVEEVVLNFEPLQRAWAREHLSDPERRSLAEIALEQIRLFRPDIVWSGIQDENILRAIRSEVDSVRWILGWVGSSLPDSDVWGQMDLVLSCAPESVQILRRQGVKAAHLNHGFDPRAIERLQKNDEAISFSFIGQIFRGQGYHLIREVFLEKLVESGLNLQIFSPGVRARQELLLPFKIALYDVARALVKIGIKEQILANIPVLSKTRTWRARPQSQNLRRLQSHLRTAVFGLEMYSVIATSDLVLNVHADSSPANASNMRLFETTGVGTCLLTDWKEDIASLFEPDTEVVVYKSPEECMEKAKWLLEHPKERAKIAMAGQQRTLRDHTFSTRAAHLDDLLVALRRGEAGVRKSFVV
jgi:spore maturation protein CgeB